MGGQKRRVLERLHRNFGKSVSDQTSNLSFIAAQDVFTPYRNRLANHIGYTIVGEIRVLTDCQKLSELATNLSIAILTVPALVATGLRLFLRISGGLTTRNVVFIQSEHLALSYASS